jgi:hypothetical protein
MVTMQGGVFGCVSTSGDIIAGTTTGATVPATSEGAQQ